MRRVAWRPVLLAICAIAALAQIAGVLDTTGMGGAPPWLGRLGTTYVASSKPFNLVVRSVAPGGPAAQAGLRQGDLIDIRANTLVQRLPFVIGAPLNRRPQVYSVHRGPLHIELTAIARPLPAGLYWPTLIGAFGSLWLLLFAALIAWRRADVPEMRLLSLWLAVSTLAGVSLATPWVWVYILFSISSTTAATLAVALWAALAGCFAQPLSRPRRITQWLCYTLVAILIVINAAGIAGMITLKFDPLPITNGPVFLLFMTAILTALACSVMAIAAARGVERQRAVWTLVPLAAISCYFILYGLVISSSSSFASAIILVVVGNLVLLAAPVALTYAALSRRLIDIGFFLNRAAVFAIVSTIVIGVFVLVEWAASEWLVSASHTTSTVIGMGVALGLGLSLRYIHKYVDRFVDRVLFRRRHEDEAALRRFAHESSYITDRSILLERAVREVEEHTNAAEATILVQDGVATYTSAKGDGVRMIASENDPGILALRAWHKPVDLGSLADSVLRGEFAFPMVSRGTLMGVLVCGAKRNGEAYAPDESEALLALAHGVGSALDVLSAQRDHPNELVLRELAELREDVKRMSHT
jgi:hypothetical protein